MVMTMTIVRHAEVAALQEQAGLEPNLKAARLGPYVHKFPFERQDNLPGKCQWYTAPAARSPTAPVFTLAMMCVQSHVVGRAP